MDCFNMISQFINNGLRCITKILNDGNVTEQLDNFPECVRRAGEVLRVLTFVAEPLRTEGSLLPPLECDVQDEFFEEICNKLRDIESLLTRNDGDLTTKGGQSEVSRAVMFLGRLLQFDLGFHGVWTPATTTAGSSLSSTLLQLAIVCHFLLHEWFILTLNSHMVQETISILLHSPYLSTHYIILLTVCPFPVTILLY